MKKLLILLITLIPFVASAQEKMSVVTLKSGTELKGVIKAIDPTDALTIVIAGIETTIKMADIAKVESFSDNSINPTNEEKKNVELVPVIVEDPLKVFKGFLLAKGNNVYVYHGNTDEDTDAKYDKEAANVIRDLLKADGFWNVVDNMNQAHFTINYVVITEGLDSSYISVSSWRTGKSHVLAAKRSSESINENKLLAHRFYKKAIISLQKKIEKGKISKKVLEDFTVK